MVSHRCGHASGLTRRIGELDRRGTEGNAKFIRRHDGPLRGAPSLILAGGEAVALTLEEPKCGRHEPGRRAFDSDLYASV